MTARPMLRELLEDVLATSPDFPARFYERLFVAHPELRPMFHRSSPDAQQKMFAQKLMMVVDAIENPDVLRRELGPVATTHAAYGVTREMYDWVGAALHDTVKEVLDGRATAEQLAALIAGWQLLTGVVFELS